MIKLLKPLVQIHGVDCPSIPFKEHPEGQVNGDSVHISFESDLIENV